MADQGPDRLARAQQELVGRMTDLAHALAELNPVAIAGRRTEEVVRGTMQLLQSLARFGELTIDPLAALIGSQRELADRMAEWAQLQRELAERMEEWADLQRQFANALDPLLAPLAQGGHRVAQVLGDISRSEHLAGREEDRPREGGAERPPGRRSGGES